MQQQVSQRYVEAGTTTTASDALQAMTREVLSRGRLLRIIDELGLYPKAKERLTPERLAEQMRKDIAVDPLDQVSGRSDLKAFKITFTAETPQLAQSGASRLTSLFIEEQLKTRGDQATKTTNFLTEQLEAAKKQLEEQEQRLQDFKMRNLSELPEQQQANLSNLTELRIQLQNTMSGLSRAQQQHTSLEALIGARIGANLARLQSERSNLLTRYTPRHPEVIKKDQEIAKIQALVERLKTGTPGIGNPVIEAMPDDTAVALLTSQMDASASETEALSKDERRLRAELATSQNRMNLVPVREQQLAGILRDYDSYKKDYTDLLAKQIQSQQTVSLEARQDGQQFRLVDPPTLPIEPSSPKRLKISLGGAAGGLFAGLALAFLIDTGKNCFYGEKELRQKFALPLVVGVPLLLTPAERRAGSWTRAFEWLVASAMTLAVCAAEFYVYRHG